MIEYDNRNGIILTSGDDNNLCIRKLYDFELLTCIKIKQKFIIIMAKISPKNFLYILCYNKNKIDGDSYIIFGYTLSGLKFAKSAYSFYTNIEFTENGNIVTLINEEKIAFLEGHNLNLMKIDDNKDFEKIQKNLCKSHWFQYHDFHKYYGFKRKTISYLSSKKSKNYLKTSEVTNISFFD